MQYELLQSKTYVYPLLLLFSNERALESKFLPISESVDNTAPFRIVIADEASPRDINIIMVTTETAAVEVEENNLPNNIL